MNKVDNKDESVTESTILPINGDLTKTLVTGAAGLILIIGLRSIAQELISPILLAIFVAVLLNPIYKVFRRKGLSSTISMILMIITIIVAMGLFGLFLSFTFHSLSDSLSDYTDNIREQIQISLETTSRYIGVDGVISKSTIETIPNEINTEKISTMLQRAISGLGTLIYLFVFIPFLAIMMILQFDSMPKTISDELDKNTLAVKRFKKFSNSITVYIVARGKVNAFTGILFAIALALIGVEYAILWGILVAILSFIPYIGIVIASIPPVLIAFTTGGWVMASLVIISVIIVNVLAENVLDPYIQGQSNKISALTVIIALIFWVWLLGPVGGILSVPLTVLLKIILEEFDETKWIALIMEGNYSEGADQAKKKGVITKFTNRVKNIRN